MEEIDLNIIVAGYGNSGKTTYLQKVSELIAKPIFSRMRSSTATIIERCARIFYSGKRRIHVNFYDTNEPVFNGRFLFEGRDTMDFNQLHALISIFDSTSIISFECATQCITEFRSRNPSAPIILISNKMKEGKSIPVSDVSPIMGRFEKIEYYEMDVKSNHNHVLPFYSILRSHSKLSNFPPRCMFSKCRDYRHDKFHLI